MSESSSNPVHSPLERIVEILRRRGVEFVVIGGEAATIHGSPLATFEAERFEALRI